MRIRLTIIQIDLFYAMSFMAVVVRYGILMKILMMQHNSILL